MNRQLTDTVEDYLKVIYKLSVESCRVSTGQIADALGVSPASVTDMVQRLAGETPPLLDYLKHQGVALTDEGKTAALETLRHHRLLELFLHEVLGYSWDQVHAEADRLEHVISEEFEDRVAAVLGNPQRGLHGEPIPSRTLEMPDQDTCYLQDMRPGQKGIVHSVSDDDPGFLRFLEAQGLVPGAEFSVVGFSPYDDNLRLRMDGASEEIVLGASITAHVQVEIKDKVTQI
ncbi:MAG: metal-dependent transcriptional regulator [Anaerolineales bacterium]|nr:metal-dependent transcriptional regulator [Anaerolineales bacterium]